MAERILADRVAALSDLRASAEALERQLKPTLDAEQARLLFRLRDADTTRYLEQHEAELWRVIDGVAAHFGALGPAILAVAAHVEGIDIDPGCCERPPEPGEGAGGSAS